MAGVAINYKLNLDPALDLFHSLEAFQSRAMFDDIGSYLDSEVTNRFKEGKDPQGNGWIPSERALNEGGSTLIDHGHLRDSITHQVFIDGSGVEHGSNMIYAAIHQFGGETGAAGHRFEMIARPFIGINDADEAEIANIVEDHIRMALQ